MALEVGRGQVIAHRWRAHQLDREPGAASGLDDVAMLDVGVQDTGPVAARWALVNRGLASYDEAEALLAWTVRSSPHLYRRADAAAVAVATAPLSENDAARRVFDASKPLRQAGIPVLEALAVIARTQRALVRKPTVKGDLSTSLTERLEPHSLRYCRPCDAIHAWENPFRMAPLQAGLELQPGTSPPVLQRITGLRPLYFRTPGTQAEPRFDQVRGYLHYFGPARPQEVAAHLDSAVKDVRAHWPDDAVPVDVDGFPGVSGDRFALEEDVASLTSGPERAGRVRLLAPFDPWLQLRERATLVDDRARAKDLWRNLGRPGAVVVDGEVVGTWRPKSAGARLTITWEPWARLAKAQVARAEHEAGLLAEVRGQVLAGFVRAD